LTQRLFEEFRVTIGEAAVGRALLQMGYRKLSARHHAQDATAAAAFEQTSPSAWRRLPRAIRASR
jgi:hypothetical protein